VPCGIVYDLVHSRLQPGRMQYAYRNPTGYWAGGLKALSPGKGYKVYSNNSLTFTYSNSNRETHPKLARRLSVANNTGSPLFGSPLPAFQCAHQPWTTSDDVALLSLKIGAANTYVYLNGTQIGWGWPSNPDAYCDSLGAFHYGYGTVLGSTTNNSGFTYGEGFPFKVQAEIGYIVEFKYWNSQNSTTYYSTTLITIGAGDTWGDTANPYIIHVETTRNPCRFCENFLNSDPSSTSPMQTGSPVEDPPYFACRPGAHLTNTRSTCLLTYHSSPHCVGRRSNQTMGYNGV